MRKKWHNSSWRNREDWRETDHKNQESGVPVGEMNYGTRVMIGKPQL